MSAPATSPEPSLTVGDLRSSLNLTTLLRNGIVGALILEIIVFSIVADRFLTVSNLRLILLQTSVILILAVPSAILLLSGYVDFAVGSTVGLCAVVLGRLLAGGWSVWSACITIVLMALGIGLIQGGLVTYSKMPTFVVTLGAFTGLRGLAFVVNDGRISNQFGRTFAHIGRGLVRVLDIPVPVGLALLVFLIVTVFLYQTRWGRYVKAIGINPTAAFRAGIKVKLIPMLLYGATSVAAAIGAMIAVSRLDSAPPTLGEGLELDVLSAVLLGGVAFSGGRGNLLGVFAGVLFIGVLNNGLLLFGVQPFWFRVSAGAALVVAAGLDAITRRIEDKRAGVG
ncbi:MAG: ABC transporter permease [Acidimicrobiia bacterium]|nr:ABC transporter permease [Acidimicrobiia bacterium]MDH4308182.1 ABC transporter permease [Acidimicrobiia bacterium]